MVNGPDGTRPAKIIAGQVSTPSFIAAGTAYYHVIPMG